MSEKKIKERLGKTKDIPLSRWLLIREGKFLPPVGFLAMSQGTVFDCHILGVNASGI